MFPKKGITICCQPVKKSKQVSCTSWPSVMIIIPLNTLEK